METPRRGGEVGHRGGSWAKDWVTLLRSVTAALCHSAESKLQKNRRGGIWEEPWQRPERRWWWHEPRGELWRQEEVVRFWIYPEEHGQHTCWWVQCREGENRFKGNRKDGWANGRMRLPWTKSVGGTGQEEIRSSILNKNTRCLTGSQVEMLCKKLDKWAWSPGGWSRWKYKVEIYPLAGHT